MRWGVLIVDSSAIYQYIPRTEMITVSVLRHSPHYFIHGVYHADVVTYMKVEVFIFTSKLLQQELASQGKEG